MIAELAALPDLASVVATIMASAGYRARFEAGQGPVPSLARALGRNRKTQTVLRPDPYLAPRQLEVSDDGPRRVLLIGGCFMFEWPDALGALGFPVEFDRILFMNASEPPTPPREPAYYDLQMIQVPLTSILHEIEYLRLAYDDPAAYERFFAECVARLELFMSLALKYHGQITTFVPGYICPQQNLVGRAGPRYDLRNPIYFIERLNAEVERVVTRYTDCHYIDADHIVSVSGRRFYQQDFIATQFHGGFINTLLDRALDGRRRLERSPPIDKIYDLAPETSISAIFQEMRARWRTLKGIDAVKMVCIDLDDTLWRGVVGEFDLTEDSDTNTMTIGWPRGLIEVLHYLKKRGIILAIVSKNDEARVRRL